MSLQKQPAVICKGVTKTFTVGNNHVYALRGVDLVVDAGELMMLVGPSGCGKTTLISVIAGILRSDGGDCQVLGRDFRKISSNEIIEFRGKNIGFIFQTFNLLPALTIEENVAVPLIINGSDRHLALKKAREVLSEVWLGDRTESMPSQLSTGQQQRVAIARALVHEPGLLVCDEPTSALDHKTGVMVMEMLKRAVHNRGATMIVVTHDARIFEYADCIAQMDDGAIINVGEKAIETNESGA